MDVLSAVLRTLEVRGSVFCFGPVRAPWRFEGGAEGRCLFHAVVEGGAWLTTGGGDPIRLGAGDVVLLPRGGRHVMGSAPEGPAVPLREAVGRAADAPFARFAIGGDGPRSYLICGSFAVEGMDWHPLLRALPELIVVNAGLGRWLGTTITSLERYLDGEEPGAALVTSRLTEILFVQSIATWLDARDAPDGWLAALRDPQLGRALALIHDDPAADWTAERLGRAVGLSRRALYTRFAELLGETPARYLAGWRMSVAARALSDEGLSVAEASERVGYASVPSFTRAFRAHHGQTPAAYRRAQRG